HGHAAVADAAPGGRSVHRHSTDTVLRLKPLAGCWGVLGRAFYLTWFVPGRLSFRVNWVHHGAEPSTHLSDTARPSLLGTWYWVHGTPERLPRILVKPTGEDRLNGQGLPIP